MSEDVKPRLKTTDETFGLMARTEIVNWIELEPTMRMMDELAEALEQRKCDEAINNEGSGMFNKHDSNCAKCFILEKYRKFKEEVK